MEPKLNQDLVSTIMLELPLKDVQSLILTDRLAASVDTNTFWKQKFQKNFTEVKPITNMWKYEYYKMYQSYITATKFVQMLELLISTTNQFEIFYIPNDLNLKTIDWLPPNIAKALNKSIVHDPLAFMVTFNITFKYFMVLHYKMDQYYSLTDSIEKLEFINIISQFLYYYPDIKFNKDIDNTLLYKDLINKPNLSIYEQKVLFIWQQI